MVLSLPSFKEGHDGISSEHVYIPQALFPFIRNIMTYPPAARCIVSLSSPPGLAANRTDFTLSGVILWKDLTFYVRRFAFHLVYKREQPQVVGIQSERVSVCT